MTERHGPFVGCVGRQQFERLSTDTAATALLGSREAAELVDLAQRERMSRGAAAAIEPEAIKSVGFSGYKPHVASEGLDVFKVVLR